MLEKMFIFQIEIFEKIITSKIAWHKTFFMVISIKSLVILIYQFLDDGGLL